MKKLIKELCEKIEKTENIKIIFAIENGSRVWKMESQDSDYDVRFVFKRQPKEYLKINPSLDVINIAFDKSGNKCDVCESLIDMSGFDIVKFARLLSKSNPTAIEWLMSDVVYYKKQNTIFRKFAKNNFSPSALYYHYKSMSKNNYEKYIKSNKCVTLKKYLYALRGLINAKWVEYKNGLPPIVFNVAVDELKEFLPKYLVIKIKEIIKIKSSGEEKNIVQRIKKIDRYIEEFLNEDIKFKKKKVVNLTEINREISRIILHEK